MPTTIHPHPDGCIEVGVGFDRYFSITGGVYSCDPEQLPSLGYRRKDSVRITLGCLKAEDFPEELRPLCRFHLVGADGPIHYVENTLYHASNRDFNGLLPGETRQATDAHGKPLWCLPYTPIKAGDRPPPVEWEPLMLPPGNKECNLQAARNSACWPDATDEELLSATKETLMARLPALMKEFVTVCGEYLPKEVIDRWS